MASPYLVSVSDEAASLLDLDPTELGSERFLNMLAGNLLPQGAEPLAMLYAGHQFGTFVPQLGDGRALLLGEVVNARNERWSMQLKGAGETPFSRSAGRARGAALDHPRISVLGGHACAGYPHHARPGHRRRRRAGVPGKRGNGRGTAAPVALACALRIVRGVLPRGAKPNTCASSPTT